MLLVFIAHLFVGKLRRLFAVKIEEPGPSPYIEAPVPLSDYIEAAVKLKKKEEICHPKFTFHPDIAQ
jgi:hypothetical protein